MRVLESELPLSDYQGLGKTGIAADGGGAHHALIVLKLGLDNGKSVTGYPETA